MEPKSIWKPKRSQTEEKKEELRSGEEMKVRSQEKRKTRKRRSNKSIVPKEAKQSQEPEQIPSGKEEIETSEKTPQNKRIGNKILNKNSFSEKKLKNHSYLAADIIKRLENNLYECMICTDILKRQVTVWNCTNCYSLFHLYCIKKWSKSSENDGKTWICPGCQYLYVSKPIPKCFCGKTIDPQFNAYLVPHSCGEICGKKLVGEGCPHSCNMICHPGHCPPCPAIGPAKTCFCGGTQYRLRCGEKDPGKSCGEECEKTLSCGKHKCKQICHDGPCNSCEQTEVQMCYCGKITESRPCGSGNMDTSQGNPRFFSCNEICNKQLSCENHRCLDKCHPGNCKECQLLPKNCTTCPCGKIPLPLLNCQRNSCQDPLATCPNKCEKKMECGHKCQKTCHLGPCSGCDQKIKISCPCGSSSSHGVCSGKSTTQTLPSCKKKCKMLRSCGRHACGKECCPSSSISDPNKLDPQGIHICSLPCNRKLKCGKHFCDLLCHAGTCPPCGITFHEQYVCECGKTKMDPPIICGTQLPECPHPCVRSQPCGHPTNHPCHDVLSPCPPCKVPVDKWCAGGHEIRHQIPCCLQEIYCGRKCGKPLSCKQHVCQRICHSGPCILSEVVSESDTISCGQICGQKRVHCNHTCESICHPNKPCPSIQCKFQIRIYCPCKRRSIDTECLRGGEDDKFFNMTKQLMCDEQCEKEKRDKQLAEAFGIVVNEENYSDLLLNLGKANPSLIAKIESQFAELIKGSSSKYSFPPTDRLQRQIIHELAKHYNIDTQSFDREPLRNVVASKKPESKIPKILLSQAILNYTKTTKQPNPLTPHILEIYGMNSNIRTEHIMAFLHPHNGHYIIEWIDETNALIIFQDSNRMKTAKYLLSGGPFNVKEYSNNPQTPETPKLEKKLRQTSPSITQHEESKFQPFEPVENWEDI